MRIVGLIPARGGSVRIPKKNLERIGKDTLVERAIKSAFMARSLDLVAVTSDDPFIQRLSRDAGAFVIERPAELSRGDQPMQLTVVAHALDVMEAAGNHFDAVMLLQPSSPLRTAVDMDGCAEILEGIRAADSVVSVTAGGEGIAFQVRHAKRLERIPDIVIPNGAIYLMRIASLREGKNWFSGETYAYQMPKDRSVDIDTPADLEIARMMVKHAEGL